MTTQGIFLNDHFFSDERVLLRKYYEDIFGTLPTQIKKEIKFTSYDRRYKSGIRIQPCTFFYTGEIKEILAQKNARRSSAIKKLESLYMELQNV